MKPKYYIFRFEENGPSIHEVNKYYEFAVDRARQLTLETGITHSVVKDVVMFEKPQLIVTTYDEF